MKEIDSMLRLEEGPVKTWYENHMDRRIFSEIVDRFQRQRYDLDPKSGLMYRRPFSEDAQKAIGHTILDIVFPRPTDLHYHTDVDELIQVYTGKGYLYLQRGKEELRERPLHPGVEKVIGVNEPHAFGPDEDGLEIYLVCTGIIDPANEICVKRFDEFEPWKERYPEIKNP